MAIQLTMNPADVRAQRPELGRRLLAAEIDSAIVLALTVAVALLLADRPSSLVANAAPVTWRWGDTLLVWSTGAAVSVLTAAVLFAVIVLVLLPANLSGWTPGLRLAALGRSHANPSTEVEPMTWSERHQTWLYRDEVSGRWLRHDDTLRRWVSVD